MLMELDGGLPRDAKLAEALAALANPVRLALLRQVRTPKALSEIRIRPMEVGPGGADRALARQTVKTHLDRLVEIGVVIPREGEREYGATTEYLLNHQTLYALAEEFRELAKLRAAADPGGVTRAGEEHAPATDLRRPCLMLVKGLEEGRTFDLTPPTAGRRDWMIGRRRGLDVSLDFDPFVSTEHAAVTWDGKAYLLHDQPESRNGTFLNFRPLDKGAPARLQTGDVIGVGRSLLMFREPSPSVSPP